MNELHTLEPQGKVLSPTPGVIFFDMGQTLVAGARPSARRVIGSLLGLSEKEIKGVGRLIMTYPALAPDHLVVPLLTLLPGRSPAELRAVLGIVWRAQAESVMIRDGALPLLIALKDKGLGIGVISNTWQPFHNAACRRIEELNTLVDYWVLSYRLGIKKPSVRIFEEALRVSGGTAESCWMVGDSYELDMKPALKAGMRTMWLLSGPERELDMLVGTMRGELEPPHWVAENLWEVGRYFLGRDK